MDETTIELALKQAEQAHSQYEHDLGHPDLDWPKFYAHFIYQKYFAATAKLRKAS